MGGAGRCWGALAHGGAGTGGVRRHFKREGMARVRVAMAAAEKGHAGGIRFAIEASLPPRVLRRHRHARSRAIDVFSQLRVWDTEANTGVLLYLLWADRAIEVVTDRGIAALIPASAWETVCAEVASSLHTMPPADAVLAGIARIGALLRAALPVQDTTPDELPDAPVVL